jgi:hypothetical protein
MSSNKIKFVMGRFIYIEMPPKPETKVIVDENTKEALQKAMLENLRVTTVFAKGDAVSDKINVGDKVLVNPASLANPSTSIITLKNSEDEDVVVALIQDYDIIHVWDE